MNARVSLWSAESDVLSSALKALPAYLVRQRWYPAKDLGEPTVTLTSLIPFDGPGVSAAIAVWHVTPLGGTPLELFLPLSLLAGTQGGNVPESTVICRISADATLSDAFFDDAFVRAFVRLMLDGKAAAPAGLNAGHTHAAKDIAGTGGGVMSIRRGSVEQSNTSIRIGDGAMLKVIRKLVRGNHPELEMGRHLTERTSFKAIPALLGWIDLDGSTLCVLQAFVPNGGDGWTWVVNRLRDGSNTQLDAALRWARTLGQRTAEMHAALAVPTGDAAFDPEPAVAQDWQRWSRDIEAMAQGVRDGLERQRGAFTPAVARIADAFDKRRHTLARSLAKLVAAASGVSKTRHHGDFHLGQVLVCNDDAILVDFEGEPLRSLDDRRAKRVPLRDVAGMLRSFDYAAAVAERDRPELARRLEQWATAAATHFLDGYFARIGPGHDRSATLRLVQFFTMEKALYEVQYELANRPEWVPIPLRSVLAVLESAETMTRRHELPQGAELLSSDRVRFRLWAPGCDQVRVALRSHKDAPERVLALVAGTTGEGWHELVVADAGAGTRYQFVLPDGMRVPDPASRFQPEDVHGPSEVIDPFSYTWRDGEWQGRPWHEAVLYELHVGTFTGAGTFRAAIDRLDHLVAMGITGIEIMPVADFPGGRNWGYDGVLLYAPDSSYGRPEDLKALVDAAHARGILVLLDVVYNHFGPDGNYLPVYAPAFFTDRHTTPWGAAVNYDGPQSKPVREFVIHNALYWLEEFNLDGLRLDAVHAILDDGPRHVLDELAERARARPRPVHLVLENEENQTRRLLRNAQGDPTHFTAQWNDDLHHVLHVAATSEATGYYVEYLNETELLGRALAEGFAFQGQMMKFRGEPRGEPSGLLPPTAFVAFIQNHDQIGNRAFGDRLSSIAPHAALRAIAAVYLLLPQVPMLFMGEEWAAAQPFPFFCDFHGELAEAVRKGRRQEFAKFPEFQDEAIREQIPDPQAEATFASAKLNWGDVGKPPHAVWLDFYTRLIAARHDSIVPLIPLLTGHAGSFEVLDAGAVIVRWQLPEQRELTLHANLSNQRRDVFRASPGRTLWQEGGDGEPLAGAPWSVRWQLS